MEFVLLDEDEFRMFALKHPLKSFLQTPEMAQVRKAMGWDSHYVGVKKDGVILAGAMMVSKVRHFGKREFYSPHGPLIDFMDVALLTFFTKELKKYLKSQNAYVFRMDPYYPLIERDIQGDIVEDGFDHREAVSNLKKLGYHQSDSVMQVFKFLFALDLDISRDELWERMRTFTKRNIVKAEKNGIVLREATRDEIPLVKHVIDSTSERKQFSGRTLSYYQSLYDAFSPSDEIKFLLGELHLKDYILRLKKELEEEEGHLALLVKQDAKEDKRKRQENQIEKLKTALIEASELREKEGEVLILSGGVFLLYGDEVLYLFGGNYKEYMKFGASYFMQWKMINYGMEHGYKRYNFYGISDNFDKNSKDYGVYDFKKGFTGYVEEMIGDFELPLHGIYYLGSGIRKIKRLILGKKG